MVAVTNNDRTSFALHDVTLVISYKAFGDPPCIINAPYQEHVSCIKVAIPKNASRKGPVWERRIHVLLRGYEVDHFPLSPRSFGGTITLSRQVAELPGKRGTDSEDRNLLTRGERIPALLLATPMMWPQR
jgi:hypothetical protein